MQPESDTTVRSLFAQMDEWGAAVMQILLRDATDAVIAAVIIVRGTEEAVEITDAVDAIQERWNES